MQLAEFPGQTVVIAKDQPAIALAVLSWSTSPMPAHIGADGTVTCCWSLTWRERLRVLFAGRIWHQILTFGHPLQPQLLDVAPPNLHRTDAL
jgi:hypothetical protein